MSYGAAVGVEQVGGVTAAAGGMVTNADGRVQSAKTLNNVSEGTNGRMVGPAGDLMRGTMNEHSNASQMAGRHGAQVAVSAMPATAVGSANGRSTRPSTIRRPGNS